MCALAFLKKTMGVVWAFGMLSIFIDLTLIVLNMVNQYAENSLVNYDG
uniref:Uncharacterized protein n=1 Tax=Arundo donax TaxID=35708 RepID=A0A0A8YJG2_ARUDO